MKNEKIVEIVAFVLEIDPQKILKSNNFVDDLGADSADMANMIADIETVAKIEIAEKWAPLMLSVENISKVVKLIKSKKEDKLEKLLQKTIDQKSF